MTDTNQAAMRLLTMLHSPTTRRLGGRPILSQRDEEDLRAVLAARARATAPTEWGTAGCLWAVGYHSDGRPTVHEANGEHGARMMLADWDQDDPHQPVLLRAERSAWHRVADADAEETGSCGDDAR